MSDRAPTAFDGALADIARAVHRDPALADGLADEAVRRIDAVNPSLNAVVDRADDGPSPTPRGSLAGVPILLKDLQADAADVPLRRGSRVYRDARPRGDSHLVTRLRRAGARVLGRTNTPEFGLNCVTEPELWGPARNPWDTTRTPGGSSGGAAAAVAAGMIPVAHSTDSGGSTRVPAAWCGVVGFKPTRGVVPAGPFRTDDWSGFSHEHAITRTVADARTMFAVLGGPQLGEAQPFPALAPAPPGPMRVGVLRGAPGGGEIHPDYRRALDEARRELSRSGHVVSDIDPPEAATRVGPVFGGIAAAHLAAYAARDAALDWGALEPATAELLARGRAMAASELVALQSAMRTLARELAAATADVDLVLSTTTSWPAPLLGAMPTTQPLGDLVAEIFRLAPVPVVFNVTGGPAISVPWGLDRSGMPIGIHLGARPGADRMVLAVAQTLEASSPPLPRPPAAWKKAP